MFAKWMASAAFAACLFAPCASPAQTATPATVASASPALKPAEKPDLAYLNPADLLPQRLLALPPIRESATEARELAAVRTLIAASTPDRITQAAWDNDHEDPTLYNATLGMDLEKLPATWRLLITVQDEAYAASNIAKDAFGRVRPYGIDPTLPTCVKVDPTKAARSYPSGHATIGYAVGWALVRLMPERAPAILERADDYALSRQICGAHFASDTEASHVLAAVVTDRLLADPRLASQIAAARAELTAR